MALMVSAPLYATVEEEATQIVDAIYDLQFDRAEKAAVDLSARYPDSPAGDFYRSVGYYQRYLIEDPPQAQTLDAFFKANDLALKKAARLTPQSPAMGHYYKGAALGFEARVYIAQKHFTSAVPAARQGVKELAEAIRLDPSLIDAKLGLGMYDYFLDRIPPAAKPVTFVMVGLWGNRPKGLALLREVAEKGGASRPEAQFILAAIDASQKEQKWDEAERLFRTLKEHYPHNPRYRMKLVYVLQRKGLWEEAAQIADPEGAWIQTLDPIVRQRAQSSARYRAAENLLFAGHWQDAVILLDRLESADISPAMEDWVALRRGNSLDAQGRSGDAAAYYNAIQGKKAKALAEIFEKHPFPDGPRDVMPAHWPLPNIPLE